MFDDPNVPDINSGIKRYAFTSEYISDLKTLIIEFYRDKYRIELSKYLRPYNLLADELNDFYYGSKEIYKGRYLWRLVTNTEVGKKQNIEKILRIRDYIENKRWVLDDPDTYYVKQIKLFIDEIDRIYEQNGFPTLVTKFEELIKKRFDESEEYFRCLLILHFSRFAIPSHYDIDYLDELLTRCLGYFSQHKHLQDAQSVKMCLSTVKYYKNDRLLSDKYLEEYIDYAIQKSDDIALATAYGNKASLLYNDYNYLGTIQWSDECIAVSNKLVASKSLNENWAGMTFLANCYVNKGKAYKELGLVAEARDAYAMAIHAQRQIKATRNLGISLMEFANLEGLLGGTKETVERHLKEANSIFENLGLMGLQCDCEDLRSRLAFHFGDKALSINILLELYKRIQSSGDVYAIVDTMKRIANWYYRDERNKSYEWYSKIIQFIDDNNIAGYGYLDAIGNSILGEVDYINGNVSKAEQHFNVSLTRFRNYLVGEVDERRKAYIFSRMADVYTFWQKHDEAIKYYSKAFRLYTTLGDVFHLSSCGVILADRLIQVGRYNYALPYLTFIEAKLENTDFHALRTQTSLGLCQCHIKIDIEKAKSYLLQAKEINNLHNLKMDSQIYKVEFQISN